MAFAGVEGELQLRAVLPAGEREGRQIPGRGAQARGLPVQWPRRLPRGELYSSLSSVSSSFFLKWGKVWQSCGESLMGSDGKDLFAELPLSRVFVKFGIRRLRGLGVDRLWINDVCNC